ncbi:MAG TPA: aldehyde dehydrogenase [Bacteriovoracaceae bacterium]|nr:aldehyde dehydrogenase [Bacteriovoracaceae bacterium]
MNLQNLAEDLHTALTAHGALPQQKRRVLLQRLKAVIQKMEPAITKALKDDLGKSAFESYVTEVGFILEELSHALKHLDGWMKPKRVGTPLTLFPGSSHIHAEPYGVVLVISPWNYPFQLCMSPLIGALSAGNRVVLKPSEFAPRTSEIIKAITDEVFKDNEVVTVPGGLSETQTLLAQKFDYIFFTGSTNVGRIIMKAAAENLTPLTLELGGKSPCVIDESANIDISAKRCAWGKFLNAGQTCVAPDFVLVPKKLQDEFISKVNQHLATFYGKDARNSDDYARIINTNHFDRLSTLLASGKVAGGGKFDRDEKYIEPTVLRDVSWEDKVMQEEIFGPILPVVPYENLEEVIKKLRSLPKPLAFYVFGQNSQRTKKIIDQVPFGGGCINDTLLHLTNPNLPFGGIGPSGLGSYHGKKSFDTFTHYKSVFEQMTAVDIPIRYPPYKGKLSWVKFLLR